MGSLEVKRELFFWRVRSAARFCAPRSRAISARSALECGRVPAPLSSRTALEETNGKIHPAEKRREDARALQSRLRLRNCFAESFRRAVGIHWRRTRGKTGSPAGLTPAIPPAT